MVMLLITGIVFSTLILSLIAFPFPASAQKGPHFIPGSEVVGVFGKIPGQDLIVHVWVVVPPGADKNEAANEALRNQGARPLTPHEFSTISLFWDQFSDAVSDNDFVTQYYNPSNDPTEEVLGEPALLSTHSTWTAPTTSMFALFYGGTTDRCPSLVKECRGPQFFDGFNDVAWLELRGDNTLAVTWSGTSIDEADIALNLNFDWATDGVNHFDAETIFLHENGHVAGLGHSEFQKAVMYPSYQEVRRALHQDDKDGITSLYPATGTPNAFPTVTTTSPADGSTFHVKEIITFSGSANDTEDGDLTANLGWTSSIDGSIGTGGSFSKTLSEGTHTITASVTDSGGKTGSASISITVVNDSPLVSITSPTDGSTFDSGATINFAGSASDTEDGVLTASLAWTSDINGPIGTGGSFSTTLSDGSHTIMASVTDSGGKTGSASISITVGTPPATPTAASVVDPIIYSTDGGKNSDKHLLITVTIVNDFGNVVSGASVSIDLSRDGKLVGSGTGLTATDGTITFKLKNAKSGCYTTTVTNVTAEGLTWDDVTPTNEFCK